MDNLLRELIEKSEEAVLGYTDKKKSLEAEKQCAEEIRLQAMESLGETKKRKENSPDDETPKRFRRTSSDTLSYLRERSEKEYELREQEMRIKAEENKVFRELLIKNTNRNDDNVQNQLQQLQQQQQQQQSQITSQKQRIEGMLGSILNLMKNR